MLTSCCMWTTSPQTHIPQGKSQLCIFEDKEAVIKIIIRGRSSTMRHVSRTNRGAFDWLFDRSNVDSRNQNEIRWQQESICRYSQKFHKSNEIRWQQESICRYSQKFHTWCLESSSLFAEYHEFLDVLLQPFLSFFFLKAKRHVKERTGRQSWRRQSWRTFGHGEAEIFEFGDGETETCEFDTSQRVEHEAKLSARIGRLQ